jgi:hypothetical protein
MNHAATHATLPGRQAPWTADGLQAKFCEMFPEMRTGRGALDVNALRAGLSGRTREAIYKWFRRDKLPNLDVAREVVRFAALPENVAALARLDRTPPTLTELLPFV